MLTLPTSLHDETPFRKCIDKNTVTEVEIREKSHLLKDYEAGKGDE